MAGTGKCTRCCQCGDWNLKCGGKCGCVCIPRRLCAELTIHDNGNAYCEPSVHCGEFILDEATVGNDSIVWNAQIRHIGFFVELSLNVDEYGNCYWRIWINCLNQEWEIPIDPDTASEEYETGATCRVVFEPIDIGDISPCVDDPDYACTTATLRIQGYPLVEQGRTDCEHCCDGCPCVCQDICVQYIKYTLDESDPTRTAVDYVCRDLKIVSASDYTDCPTWTAVMCEGEAGETTVTLTMRKNEYTGECEFLLTDGTIEQAFSATGKCPFGIDFTLEHDDYDTGEHTLINVNCANCCECEGELPTPCCDRDYPWTEEVVGVCQRPNTPNPLPDKFLAVITSDCCPINAEVVLEYGTPSCPPSTVTTGQGCWEYKTAQLADPCNPEGFVNAHLVLCCGAEDPNNPGQAGWTLTFQELGACTGGPATDNPVDNRLLSCSPIQGNFKFEFVACGFPPDLSRTCTVNVEIFELN